MSHSQALRDKQLLGECPSHHVVITVILTWGQTSNTIETTHVICLHIALSAYFKLYVKTVEIYTDDGYIEKGTEAVLEIIVNAGDVPWAYLHQRDGSASEENCEEQKWLPAPDIRQSADQRGAQKRQQTL